MIRVIRWDRSNTMALLVAIAIVSQPGAPKAEPMPSQEVDRLRPVMREVFESMTYLLPRGLDRDRFASDKERGQILAHIESLANAAAKLENHGSDRGSSLNFLSQSLARDVEEVRMRFSAGLTEEARYFLVGSIQNCFACHARRPSSNRFPLSEELTEAVEFDKIQKTERAVLYVITRRFNEALATWEEVFEDPLVTPNQLDMDGTLADYLSVAVRGLSAYQPARLALTKVSKRDGVSTYVSKQLAAWIESLTWLENEKSAEVTIERARLLVKKAEAINTWTGDRHGLVYDLAASSVLNQLSDTKPNDWRKVDARELSETYYLLGLIESRSLGSFWLDEAPNHLEAAIRAEPSSPHAELAFALLEESMLTGYGARTPLDLPTDIWVRLDTLRVLISERVAIPGSATH